MSMKCYADRCSINKRGVLMFVHGIHMMKILRGSPDVLDADGAMLWYDRALTLAVECGVLDPRKPAYPMISVYVQAMTDALNGHLDEYNLDLDDSGVIAEHYAVEAEPCNHPHAA
jgi:hypothetical protein